MIDDRVFDVLARRWQVPDLMNVRIGQCMGSHIHKRRREAAGRPASLRVAADLQTILDGIRSLVNRLRESSREAERRIGLTAAQLFVLQLLRASDDLSVNDLAARTYTHQSSVSVVVSRHSSR